MGLQNRNGALYSATGIDNSGLYSGKREALGILRAMASEITSFDVFGGLGISAGLAFAKMAKDAYTFEKEFQKSMYEVATISDEVSGSMTDYMNKVYDLTRTIPVSANDSAKALYQIVSAGHDGADGMKILEVSAKAAVGGVTDTATAADAITTVLNAYKMSANEAEKVSDMLFTTAKLGKTTMGELGRSIAQAAPIAASYGVKIDQVLAAVASLTKQGTPTAQAMTQIRASIVGVSKVLGDGAYDTRTYQEALIEVARRANDSESQLRSLVPEIEAVNGVLAMTSKNADAAASDLLDIGNSAGAAQKAFEKMMETLDSQTKLLQNNIAEFLRPMGEGIVEEITKIATALNKAFKDGDIEESIKTLGSLIVTLTGAFIGYKGAILATTVAKRINMAVLRQAVVERNLERLAITGSMAAENLLTASQLKNIATRKVLISTIKAQTATMLKNTAAAMTNPYVLAAAAVAALGYAVYKYTTSLPPAERAQKRFNKSLKAQEKAAESLKKEISENISIIKDETAAQSKKYAALTALQGLMPAIFKNLDIEKIKRMDILDIERQTNEEKEREARISAKTNVVIKTNAYNEAKNKYSRTSSRNSNILAYYAQMMNAEEDMKVAQKYLDEILAIQSQAKKAAKEAELKELELTNAQKLKQLTKDLAEAKKSYNALIAPDARSTEAQRIAAEKKVEEIKTKIEGLTGTTDNTIKNANDKLSKQVEIIKSASDQYEKYIQVMGKEEALTKLKSDKQFSKLDLQADENGRLDVKKILEPLYIKLNNSPEQQKIKEAIENLFTEVDFDKIQKSFSLILDAISRDIEVYKTKYNLYEQLLSSSGDKEFAYKISFGGDFSEVPDLKKFIADQLKAVSKEKFDLSLDFDIKGNESIREQIGDLYNNLAPELQKMIDEIDKIKQDELSETINLYVESLNAYGNVESKRLSITEEFSKKIQAARKMGDEGLAKSLEGQQGMELLQLTDDYTRFFSSIEAMTMKSAQDISNSLLANLNTMLSNGQITYKEYMKNVKAIQDQVSKRMNQKSLFGSFSTEGLNGFLNKMNSLGQAKMTEGQALMKQGNADIKKGLSENNSELLKQGVKTEKIGNNMAKAGNKMQGFAQGAQAAGNMIDIIVTNIHNGIVATQELFDIIAEFRDSKGIDDSDSKFSKLKDYVGVLSEVDKYVSSSWDKFKNGDLAGATVDAIGSIVTIFTSFNKLHDKRLQKDIEDSERAVKKLEWAFADLERTIDKALGEDRFKQTTNLIENLKKQQAEIIKQRNAENGKKKKDQDKIDEYNRQYEVLRQQIEDTMEELKNDFIGGTAKDIADKLGDAFIEAFAKGEDAAKTWKKTVNEIIGDILKKMLITKFLEKPIGDILDEYWEKQTGQEQGANKETTQPDRENENKNTSNEDRNNRPGGNRDSSSRPGYNDRPGGTSPSSGEPVPEPDLDNMDPLEWLYEQLMNFGEEVGDKLKPFMELLKKYLGDAEEIKDGVSGQLQAAMTEETASQLVGLWNMTALDIRALKEMTAEHFQGNKVCWLDVTSILEETRLIQANTLRTANNTDGIVDTLSSVKKELEEIKKNTKTYNGRGV